MKMHALALAAAIGLVTPGLAAAEEFQTVRDQQTFLSVVTNRHLKRFGITLNVTPTGEIEGRAFGTQVTGAWRWQDGYFCRDLYYGNRDLGPNCQLVLVNGNTVRFVADEGQGDYADLRIE